MFFLDVTALQQWGHSTSLAPMPIESLNLSTFSTTLGRMTICKTRPKPVFKGFQGVIYLGYLLSRQHSPYSLQYGIKEKRAHSQREHLAAQGREPVPGLLQWIQAEEGAG